MTLNEALAVKARGLTKEQIIAHLRAVAENNLRADIRTIERAWKENREAIQKYPAQSHSTGCPPSTAATNKTAGPKFESFVRSSTFSNCDRFR